MSDKVYFNCYSIPLKEFLDSKNIRSEFKAKNCRTDRVFYLYLYDKNGQLDNALGEWSNTVKPFK